MKMIGFVVLIAASFTSSRVYAGSLDTIQCKGDSSLEILFEGAISELPLGDIPATFKNVAPFPDESAHVYIDPIFHMKHISFGTAYCTYNFALDSSVSTEHLLYSIRSCEGVETMLECDIF